MKSRLLNPRGSSLWALPAMQSWVHCSTPQVPKYEGCWRVPAIFLWWSRTYLDSCDPPKWNDLVSNTTWLKVGWIPFIFLERRISISKWTEFKDLYTLVICSIIGLDWFLNISSFFIEVKCRYLLSILIRCGTRPYERGTKWDSKSLVWVW